MYWDSWKGRVLKAIAIDGSRTWQEIQRATGLEYDELNQALSELFDANKLSKSGEKYWIEDYELYKEYVEYSSKISEPSSPDRSKASYILIPENREKLKNFLKYCKSNPQIARARVLQPVLISTLGCKDFNYSSEHLFLEGDSLDRLSKDLISFSDKRVLVVNPFVDKCSLSDKLKEACAANREVVLVSRSPNSENTQQGREQKAAYHDALKQSGVQVYYNDYVHGKLLVVDGLVALVSSMNFISSSSGGRSWEVGVVTWQEGTVNSIAKSIQNIIDSPETKIKQT